MKILWDLPGKHVRTRDFVFTSAEDGTNVARGRDDRGKPWTVYIPAAIRGLWESNPNPNRTYYFAGYTGGAGMAPDTWILALSFDSHGTPSPFYVLTYSGYDTSGIKDLLNLDGTAAILLQQTWVETNWMPEVSALREVGAPSQRTACGDFQLGAQGRVAI